MSLRTPKTPPSIAGRSRLRLFLIAAHDCRGHSKEKDGHADDRTNDSCDSFHNAVSLPRWDSGAAQNVIDLFLVAK